MRHFVKVRSETKSIGRGKNIRDVIYVYPAFLSTAKDLMRKGGKFYAVLNRDTGMWSTIEDDMLSIIDEDLYKFADEHYCKDANGFYHDDNNREVFIRTVEDSTTKQLIEFNKWFNNLPPNFNYIPLDSDLTYLSDEVTPEMYRSKRLMYDLMDGDISAYEEIVDTLYSKENREKLEWAIGSVLSGDSKKIEKFIVLYGKGGTGKSTILDLIEEIFKGYWNVFVAEDLALKSNQFATAAFKDNPLVAIQDDGSLAKIDSPRINEIVSHKVMQINEKNTKQYPLKPQAMLFMATNDTVDIHDTNLGITRRLLDVYPTGNLIPVREYRKLVTKMMNEEVPSIAKHCLEVYKKLGKEYYIKYEPVQMIQKTNYLYNFMFENSDVLEKEDPITRSDLYKKYLTYCQDLGLTFPGKGTEFGERVKQYYENFEEVKWYNGRTHRYVFSGFKTDMFLEKYKVNYDKPEWGWVHLDCTESLFDDWCKEKGFKAQYGNKYDKPITNWENVTTTMNDIDTSKLHYVLVPENENYIRIDIDFKDKDGNKSLEKCIEAANTLFPETYAEVSKGGGLHLHYFYDGDVRELAERYSKDIEIKASKGLSPIRRKLTKCNDIPRATLVKGQLPLKPERRNNVVDEYVVKNDNHLHNLVKKALRKEGGLVSTKVACDYIYKVVEEDSYQKGLSYDIRDMEKDIRVFANNSTNQSLYCTKLMAKVHMCSDDMKDGAVGVGEKDDGEKPIVIFDVEVFPNVFILCWKLKGDPTVWRMINPGRDEVKYLFEHYRMVGFNNRRYDNHICYAYAYKGYSIYELYILSQSIINTKKGERTPLFGPAYNISYLDLYDLASNPHKKSLKKWEIQLHAHHQENAYPWDEDLPEDKWNEVADYCENDVKATELVYDAIMGDVAARLILSKISGLLPNDTTNNHSMQIIFGDEKHPQSQFVYTDLSKMFPGYLFDNGVSTYKGYIVGEGGFVWALHGMYRKVKTFDVASMHPSSLIALNLFGDEFTKRFKEIKDARLAVKHKDRKALETLLGGQLLEFYDIGLKGEEFTLGDLATALKTVINSVYGLTFAGFDNRCRDPRNKDNIVAKRGALFMVDLKEEVEKRGGKVIHIKTDSIKVVDPSPELEQFIIDFGKQYGYDFEVESVYDRICLVNDAVYIAKEEDGNWTATGAEFDHPYVFKTLFSHEPIDTYDLGEVKNVSKGEMYLKYDDSDIQFIGKVSEFLPVKDENGGELVVKRDDKFSAVSGTKGFRWCEAEFIRENPIECENWIDYSYYEKLADDAIAHISEFGDFDRFVNDDNYDPVLENCINVPVDVDDEVPFDEDRCYKIA